MGDLLPEMIPGEPKWVDGVRAVLVVTVVLGMLLYACSYFVSTIGP